MKVSFSRLLILGILILLCSCTRVIHTKQVLHSLHTKDEVLKQMGPPTKITKSEGGQELIYTRDTTYTIVKSAKGDTSTSSVNGADSLKVDRIVPHIRSIKFMIDTNNNVIGYKNNGLDLSKKVKVNPLLEGLKYLGEGVLLIIVLGLSLHVQDYINF